MKSHIEVYYLILQLKTCKGGGIEHMGKERRGVDGRGGTGQANKKVRIYEKSHGN